MGWSTVPLSAGDFGAVAAMTEVKAAFDERYDAVGAAFGKPTAVSAGDFCDWSDVIAHYHTKIESLLGSFYVKSGSGTTTTFTAWTLGTLMTACFGAGVTDWRDDAEGLATIRQVNDLRTALDKLEWFSLTLSQENCHGHYVSGNDGASKDTAQDNYDAATNEVSVGWYHGLRCRYYYNTSSNQYIVWSEVFGATYYGRDMHVAYNFSVPNITLVDAWAQFTYYHQEGSGVSPNAPENNHSLTYRIGTGAVPSTIAGKASYGALSATHTLTGLLLGVVQSVDLDHTKITANTTNYIVGTGVSATGREVTDQTWPSSISSAASGYFWAMASNSGKGLYLQAQFSYRAA